MKPAKLREENTKTVTGFPELLKPNILLKVSVGNSRAVSHIKIIVRRAL